MFDSTPDVAHRDQMSEVIRYVHIDYVNKTVEVKEAFLGFIQTKEKDAEGMTKHILDKLAEDDIDIQNCRAQCYDNANVMLGHISGVGVRVLAVNKDATLVNCSNHSLNLVGVHRHLVLVKPVFPDTAFLLFLSVDDTKPNISQHVF